MMRRATISSDKLALVFATIDRPHVMQRLVRSVRKYYPTMPIYVADQSHRSDRLHIFYQNNNCQVVWMEHDAGVCASRNAAVSLVKEPYFVLCDDDFILTENTDFNPALRILDHDSAIGVVGGRLIDVHDAIPSSTTRSEQRFWELYLHYDQLKRHLITIPVHYLSPAPRLVDNVRYFICDAVMNFAVFRRQIFDDTIRWDPRFKSNGEHEDFYLNMKVHSNHRVAYTTQMVALHHHPRLQSYFKLRNRSRGWQLFLDKWNLQQFLELDGGLRITNDTRTLRPYAMGYHNFYTGPALSSGVQEKLVGTTQISNVTDELVQSRNCINTDNNIGIKEEYRLFRIFQDGNTQSVGGSWEYPASYSAALLVGEADNESIDLSHIKWSVEASSSNYEKDLGDIFVFLYPAVNASIEQVDIPGAEVAISVSAQGRYAIYFEGALTYLQPLTTNTWNAISVPNANIFGNLAIEITVTINGKVIFDDSCDIFVRARV